MTTPLNFDVAQLKELQQLTGEIQESGRLVEDAADFLRRFKHLLNEQEYEDKLEAAVGDLEAVRRLVAVQTRLRCSYLSGRLAVRCAFQQLVSRRIRLARLVKAVSDSVTSGGAGSVVQAPDLPATGSGVSLLFARCFNATLLCEAVYAQAQEWHQSVAHYDSVEADALLSLQSAYARACAGEKSGQEPEWHATDFVMHPIALEGVYLGEARFPGVAANDCLVALVDAAVEKVKGSDFYQASSAYSTSRQKLQAGRYATQLQAALLADDQKQVARLRLQQRERRAQFLASGLEVNAHYEQLNQTVNEIKVAVEELKSAVKASEGRSCATALQVAMNNVVAALSVCSGIAVLEQRWQSEWMATAGALREKGVTSLCELFSATLSTEPYAGKAFQPSEHFEEDPSAEVDDYVQP